MDLCAPRKSIQSDYLGREQVESQGGPCHVYNLTLSPSLALSFSGAIAVSPVSAVSGWLECSAAQTEHSQHPDKPSRDASATTRLSPGSKLLCQPPCLQDGPLQCTIRNHLVEETAGVMIYWGFTIPPGQKQLYLKRRFTQIAKTLFFFTCSYRFEATWLMCQSVVYQGPQHNSVRLKGVKYLLFI